jgi:hypothetical protein
MKPIVATAGMLVAVIALIALPPGPAAEKDNGWIALFNGKDLSGWTVFLDPKKEADPKKVFTVQDGILVCEGTPFGYLITDKEYENYTLKLQWRWGDKVHGKVRNSGVFVHVVGPNKIWPKAVEAQLMAGHAGDFWLVDNFKLKVDAKRRDPKVTRHYYRMKDDVEKAIREWNQYEITCQGDAIRLVINGQLVNEGTEAELAKGRILLQSEGAEIHFKEVALKPLPK